MIAPQWTKEQLIAFEENVILLFKEGQIACPVHVSSGNEEKLINIFQFIKPEDYVFSTWRSHYHYLLKGGDPQRLLDELLGLETGICKGQGRSMNIYDTSINFYTSSIVSGNCAIAAGVALGLKKQYPNKETRPHVWVFGGDGCEDSGHFIEAVRFGNARDLNLTFVVEDNDLSIDSSKKERWHNYQKIEARNILRYEYVRNFPHVGVGEFVMF